MAEQLICNQQVNGSSPLIGSTFQVIVLSHFWMVSRVAKGGRL